MCALVLLSLLPSLLFIIIIIITIYEYWLKKLKLY